jgi:hypothetical protein
MEGRIDETESMAYCQRRVSFLDPNGSFNSCSWDYGMDGLDVSGNSFLSVHCLLFQESEEKNHKPSKYHSFSGRRQDHPCRGM